MKRTDEKAWREFAAWCRARKLRHLPAHPWTVAAYARWRERRGKAAGEAVRAIGRAHLLAGRPPPDRHPTVTRTLNKIEARRDAAVDGANLFEDRDFLNDAPAPEPKPEPEARPRRTMRVRPKLVRRGPVSAG